MMLLILIVSEKKEITISKEIRTFIGNKNITTSIFRIQAYDSMGGYFCIEFIAGETLTEFTNRFYQITLKKWWYNYKLYYDKCWKMTKYNSYETHNIYPNLGVPLSNQQQLRLNKINKIRDFVAEIKERALMSKRLSNILLFWLFWQVLNCFICKNWQHFYCIICNCQWSTCRSGKCKF